MAEQKETKRKIIESAIECFSKYGYDRTSLDDICKLAGVSKGSFFSYFPTKQ